jgi:hypothetical protein
MDELDDREDTELELLDSEEEELDRLITGQTCIDPHGVS